VDIYENRVVLTINRSQGKKMANNVTTVYLTDSSKNNMLGQMYEYNNKHLIRYNGKEITNQKIMISSYLENGQYIGSNTYDISDLIDLDELGYVPSDNLSKAFLIDDTYTPLGNEIYLPW